MSDSEAPAELIEQFQSYPDGELLDMAASPNWALSTHQAVREVLKARGLAAPPLPPPPEAGWAKPACPTVDKGVEPQQEALHFTTDSDAHGLPAAVVAEFLAAKRAERAKADDVSVGSAASLVREDDDVILDSWYGCSAQYLCDRFPPTLDAEEMQRLREVVPSWNAGEPASVESASASQVARQEEAVDPALALRGAAESLSRGDRRGLERAKAILEPVLAIRSDFGEARDLLGSAQLRLREFKDAIGTYAALSKAAPDRAVYHLRQGFALHGNEQLDEAAVCYRRAMELSPIDLDARYAWVDLQIDRGQYEEAFRAWEEAATRCAGADLVPDLQRRRLEILLVSSRLAEAWSELERIRSALAGKDAVALREWSSALVAALPAKLLARGCVGQANELLRRLHWIGAGHLRTYPSGHNLEIAALPRSTQDWLAARCAPGRVSDDDQLQIAVAWLVPIVLWGFALLWTFAGDGFWGVGGIAVASLLYAGAAVGVAAVVRYTRQVVSGRYGWFSVLHPLYLLRGSLDRLSLWPCVAFMGAEVRNGALTDAHQTVAELRFACGGPGPLAVRILSDSPKSALSRLTAIDALRRWALGRIAAGLLEGEEVAKQFPPELLLPCEEGKPQAPLWLRGTVAWYGGAALAGLLLLLPAFRHNWVLAGERERKEAVAAAQRRAEVEGRWRELQAHPTLRSYRRYLELADGEHRAKVAAIASDLKRQLENELLSRPENGRDVWLSVVRAVLDHAPAVICLHADIQQWGVRTKWRSDLYVALNQAAWNDSVALVPFQSGVDAALGKNQLEVQWCSGNSAAGLILWVQPFPAKGVYTTGGKDAFELPAMDVDWSLAVHLANEMEFVHRGKGNVEAPLQIEVKPRCESIQQAQRLQADPTSKFDDDGERERLLERSREMGCQRIAEMMTRQVVRAAAVALGLEAPQVNAEESGSREDVCRLTLSSPESRGKAQ
jgi:tetratricopeptide (TPR) repeat protein